jgi:ElaB/YqjD/DUF883 family membrane-anchored ribosome-binding protein
MAETAEMAPTRTTVRKANGVARRKTATRAKADDLEHQVAQLEADIRSITPTLGRMGEMGVDEVKHRAKAQASYVAHKGQSAVEAVQDEFSDIEKHLKDTIRDKPLTAVAGALALGFVLAVITR